MFGSTADQKLDGIRAMLAAWNDEADRFRAVASAARKGEQPQSVIVAAAEEAHDGLISLLDGIDRTLEALPPGHAEFSALLNAQGAAISLLESIGNSLDVLAGFATDPVPEPVRIARRPTLVAAE